MSTEKPYRANVGIALFNAAGLVLIGHRFRDDGPEIVLPGLEWQMPQGGIDGNEDPRAAMMRELWEETGVRNASYLAETGWLTYEFPNIPVLGIVSASSAVSGKNGSRCDSPAMTAKSIRYPSATASRPNSMRGAGSASTAWPISWCRSAARFTAPWRRNLRGSRADRWSVSLRSPRRSLRPAARRWRRSRPRRR